MKIAKFLQTKNHGSSDGAPLESAKSEVKP
jgi:hypothetical protein